MSKVIVVKRWGSTEFMELVHSLGYDVFAIVEFKHADNPRFFISRGKVDEVREHIDGEVKRILIDGLLRSSQWYNLEKEFGIEVNDKIRLIIDIFADRARSREAMLQVEYAKLKYEIPFVKEMIHHQRLTEHAGWMGGGEYEVADYYEMIRKRLSRISRELEKIKHHRDERRKRRRREGFVLVGIAGYTNSGKSTLLKALTQTSRVIESRMFSTLATKTSRLGRERILVTDTVGFVEDMPPWLIRAFEPTLEEIYSADIVIILVDASETEDEIKRKVEVTLSVIEGKIRGKIIFVLNKIDTANEIDNKIKYLDEFNEVVQISAKTGEGIERLVRQIEHKANLETYEIIVESMDEDNMRYIRRFGKIEKITSMTNGFRVRFTMRRELWMRKFPQEMVLAEHRI